MDFLKLEISTEVKKKKKKKKRENQEKVNGRTGGGHDSGWRIRGRNSKQENVERGD